MERMNLSNYKLPAKIFWWLLTLTSLLFCSAAFYGIFSFSVQQFGILLVALIISSLANQHRFSVPQTKITLTAKEIVVFWAILWLGTAGGVLLAAAVAAVQQFKSPDTQTKNAAQRLFGGAVDTVAAFAAGNVFFLVLRSVLGFEEATIAGHSLHFGWLAAAFAAMAGTHYLFTALLPFAFAKLAEDCSSNPFEKQNFTRSSAKYAIGAIAAFVLHFAFLEFGMYFSLVVLPLTVFAHLAYRLHVNRFEQKTREISEAGRIHLATVEALATAIDARDQIGIGHVRRTQIYAVGIGEQMNLSTVELEALSMGALLHDIGKLAVPDHILNKPGRLTPAEFEKTKIHPSVGASILEKVPFNHPVVPTVRHHHEMWDGNGYPEGLKGENIPLTARVLAVADAYDSLRGARSYRPAVSRDEARRFLLNGGGAQFDPQIVDIFLRNLTKLEAEVEAHGLSYKFDKETAGDVHSTFDDETNQSYVEQIKRANREAFTLYELSRVFSSSLNLQKTLTLFVEKISELVPFDTCAVYLLNETEEQATAAYVQGANKSALKNKRIKIGEGATGFVLQERKKVQNIEPGLDFTYSEFDLSRDYTAMTSLPLIANEKLLGAISLYSCDLEKYEEEHIRLLETISQIASDALGKSLKHAESESRALTDPMTELPNARSLQMQFEKETARASRNGTGFQLLMLDLDGFKAVNDTFGHKAGDKLLKELARVMSAQLRDYDFLARYAGDEFVAIVPETDAQGIQELSQRIEKAVDEFVLPLGEGKCARVGISIGIGCYPNHGSTLDQIIIHADKAMYAVKAHRKQSRVTQLLPPINEVVVVEDFEPQENFIVELDESHVISSAVN